MAKTCGLNNGFQRHYEAGSGERLKIVTGMSDECMCKIKTLEETADCFQKYRQTIDLNKTETMISRKITRTLRASIRVGNHSLRPSRILDRYVEGSVIDRENRAGVLRK